MPKILQLSPHVANLIAAGEVVERPGSVAKELVENAVDAGAKHITVEIKNGGVTYLRVTDDGKGILPEDVRTAFLRLVAGVAVEAFLECCGRITQPAPAHDRELLKVKISKRITADRVGNLQPK